MLNEARFGFGRGNLHWYDLVFAALAGVIFYPDKILVWIGAKTGQHFSWKHVVLLEAMAIAALGITDWMLLPIYPRLNWWTPLLIVGMVAMSRAVMSLISRGFGDFP